MHRSRKNTSYEMQPVPDCPKETFPTTTATSSAKAYLHYMTDEHIYLPNAQRNIAKNSHIAERLFIASHWLKRLVEQYCLDEADSCSFKHHLFNTKYSTIIVDDELNIKALIDLDYSNVVLTRFTCDPPWWLTVHSSMEVLRKDYHNQQFVKLYEPEQEIFLKAMGKAETEKKYPGDPLSAKMRGSGKSGRFWFNQTMVYSWRMEYHY